MYNRIYSLDEKNNALCIGEIIDDNIIYLAGYGNILVVNDDFSKKEIKSNIKSFFNNEIDLSKNVKLLSYALKPIRDLLYHEGFLYVVIFHKESFDSDVRFSTAVLKGKFNCDYIDFEYFFKAILDSSLNLFQCYSIYGSI